MKETLSIISEQSSTGEEDDMPIVSDKWTEAYSNDRRCWLIDDFETLTI
jgi:hypothetical protein